MRNHNTFAAFDALYSLPAAAPAVQTVPSAPRVVRDARLWSTALDSVRVSPTSPYFVSLAMSAYEERLGGVATLEALADAYDLTLDGGVPGDLALSGVRGVVAERIHTHFADLCASEDEAERFTSSLGKLGRNAGERQWICGPEDLPQLDTMPTFGGPLLGYDRLTFLDTLIPPNQPVTPSQVLRYGVIPRWCAYCGAWVEPRAGSDACPWCARGELAAAPWEAEVGSAAVDHATAPALHAMLFFDSPTAAGWELLGDAADGLMRVRQLAMECDAWNLNDRLYPRSVVEEMLRGAMARARAGAMLSEFRHPKVARVDGNDRYVDNPDDKTARVDEIEMPDAQGRVYITRTILDTPQGRRVAERARSGNPFGISTRFLMKGREGVNPATGRTGTIATRMVLSTWDDVESPAVAGAGALA